MTNEYNIARYVLELMGFFGFTKIGDFEEFITGSPQALENYKDEVDEIKSKFGIVDPVKESPEILESSKAEAPAPKTK